MADTIGSLITNTLFKLGDNDSDLWSRDEIRRYILEAYKSMAQDTGILWDQQVLEDQPQAGNVTCPEELQFLEAGDTFTGLFSYTSPGEREYIDPGQWNLGPTNHNQVWEAAYLDETYYRAVHELPEELIAIERATWNQRRIEPLRSNELEFSDSQYQTVNGQVEAYLQDKDGVGSFRKWRIPSIAADSYVITGMFGLMRSVSDISSETVIGSWGVCRRLPGMELADGDGARGFPRRPWKTAHNTKIEYIRKGRAIEDDATEFEIPQVYVKYLRHYAIYRALNRTGEGQDLKFAAFWKSRWDSGLARIRKRKDAMTAGRMRVFGSQDRELCSPPLARFPWNYVKASR